MPHEKIKAARKKLEQRRRRKKAKRRASARRVRRGDPKGIREKAAVTKREATKLKDEMGESLSMGGGKNTKAAEKDDNLIDKVFTANDGGSSDSPLFQERGTDDGEPLFGSPGQGGDSDQIDMGFGTQNLDEDTAEDVDPMFGPGRGDRDEKDDQDLFRI